MFYYVVFLMARIVYWPIMMKRELSVKEKLWIYWPVYSRVHLWPRTLDSDQRMRLWIQGVEVSFIQRVAGLSLRDRVTIW